MGPKMIQVPVEPKMTQVPMGPKMTQVPIFYSQETDAGCAVEGVYLHCRKASPH